MPYPSHQWRQRWVLNATAVNVPLWYGEVWPEGISLSGTHEITNCIYLCGYMAAELLAAHIGVRKLSQYYMLLEPWMLPQDVRESELPRPGWRVAFERAFEIRVDEFYKVFEAYRAAGFPAPPARAMKYRL